MRASARRSRTHLAVNDTQLADRLESIELEYTSSERVGSPDEDAGLVRWNVTATSVPGEDDEEEQLVGRLRLATVDLYTPVEPLDLFDMVSDDSYRVGRAILGEDGRLRPELESFESTSRVIVLDTVVLEPAWRGRGLGPVLAGQALRRLSGGCGLAATYPGPLVDLGYSTEEAAQRLAVVWGKLGFTHHADGVHVLDLRKVTLDRSLRRLIAGQRRRGRRRGNPLREGAQG